ncbi:hypothetical protein GWK50_08060 [Acidovorax sp. 210-6]|uniref:hypothetical protein n=1 Tax=Acidovorax sp. 210-6 TaxID=2699468 RepID=UPI00138A391C|nr:hypothetical protein [Acidovorax sp. 210-6]NCU65790.1 hypothetical protein [Acidovorax sp. 210-6]
MSLVVFLIAALPAVAVVVVAETTRNKAAIVAAAIVAATLGLLTGNPAFVGVDLLAVALALYISWNIAKTPLPRSPEELERRRLARIAAEEAQARWDKACNQFLKNALVVVVVVVAGFLAIKFWTPATPAQPVQATAPPAAAQAAKPTAPPAAAKTAKKPPPKPSKPRTVEQCLKIADEHVMVRCLERAP